MDRIQRSWRCLQVESQQRNEFPLLLPHDANGNNECAGGEYGVVRWWVGVFGS